MQRLMVAMMILKSSNLFPNKPGQPYGRRWIEARPVGSTCPYAGSEWTDSASTDQEGNPLSQPTTYEERIAQATQMVQELDITVPVLQGESRIDYVKIKPSQADLEKAKNRRG
jgi:hypothetical protein